MSTRTASSDEPAPATGQERGLPGAVQVPGLQILDELGRGANAVVYRVRRDGSEYALKLFAATGTDGSDAERALVGFRREAAITASVDAPGLPRTHEVGQVRGRPYLVMDLVDGRSLADVLDDGPMEPEQALRVALDVAQALVAVHRKGLVHRDVKPQNIMLPGDGSARLIDFGLAARGDEGSQPGAGTLAYAPPELSGMLKRSVDGRSDLYSLGVVLFECLTGMRPFVAADPGELARMHAMVAPPDPGSIVATVPPTLGAMIALLLAKDPDDRYPSAQSLVSDLKRLAADPTAFVVGQHGGPADRRIEHPLLGRDRELDQLVQRWRRTRGGHGGICVVRGIGGCGKSRLAAELVAFARADQAFVLSGKCAPGETMPLAPVREAIDEQLRMVARLPEPERTNQLEMLRAAAGQAAPLVGLLTPALAAVLGGARNADGQHSGQFAVAVADFLTEVARGCGGMLLHVDDVQWLDPGTQQIVARLAGSLHEVPLLVLATARDDEDSLAATNEFCARLGDGLDLQVGLGPLDERAVAALVETQLPGIDAGSALTRLLTTRGNGSPFVTLEYLRAIVDAGLLRPSWDGWLLDEDGLGALELPEHALGLVTARVDALGADHRRLLTIAAVIGTAFRPELVARSCGTDLRTTLAAIAEAAGHRLVEPGNGETYVFLHDRIREALLDGLSAADLAAAHRRIADSMLESLTGGGSSAQRRDVYALAQHYLHAEPTGAQDRIFSACFAAGQLALADYAPSTAVRFLEHAAATGEPLHADFLRTLGLALHRHGRHTEAQARLNEAVDAEPTPIGRAAILADLGAVHRATWDAPAAIDAIERGLVELGAARPGHPLVALVSAATRAAVGHLAGAVGIGVGPVDGERAARDELLAMLHATAGYIGTELSRPDILLRHVLLAQHVARRLRDGQVFAQIQAGVGFTAALFGLWRVAVAAFGRAEAAAGQLGYPELMATARWFRGAGSYMARRDDGAAWEQVMEEYGRWLDPGLQDDGYSSLAWDAAVAGRTRQAVDWYERATGGAAHGTTAEISSKTTIGAVVAAATGRASQAGTELRRIRPLLQRHGNRNLYVNLLLAEVYACIEQEEFGKPFDAVVEEFDGLGIKASLAIRQHRVFWVYRALGRIAQCQRSAGTTDWAARRAVAGRALRELGRVANTRFLRCCERLARARLQLVDGEHLRCLATLAAMPTLDPDAPMLAFEVARTRARALLVIGYQPEAYRQAAYAHAVATEEGWPHRLRWIRAEFGLLGQSTGHSQSMRAATATGTGAESRQLRALAAVSRAAARVVDPDALIRLALDETVRIFAADRAFVFLTSADTAADQRLVPRLGRDAEGNDITQLTGYATTLVERVASTGEQVVVTGTDEGEALGARSAVLHGLRSILVAPLRIESRVLGVVYLDSRVAKGIFTSEDADILTALTDHIATSLETARAAQLEVSVQTARQQRDLAELLNDALSRMSAVHEPAGVLDCLLEQVARVQADQDACLLTRTDDGITASLLARDGSPRRTFAVPAEPAVTRLLALEQATAATGEQPPAPVAAHLGPVGSWLAVPVITRAAVRGVLVLAAPTADAYGQTQLKVVTALIAHGVAAFDNAHLFAQVQALAVVDELTGIANRRHFFDIAERDLAAARRHDRPVVTMMVDIDHFKRINDAHGHPTGDDVIRVVAQRLATSVRGTDVVGRYGGEEFAVLASDIELGLGEKLADQLRAAVAGAPIETRSGPLRVTVSIGIAARTADDADLASLLERADQALYQAKRLGRDRVQIG